LESLREVYQIQERNMTTIKFGTDGWRGRIAEDYTFDNVRRCTQGFANFMKAQGLADKGVIFG
jgi:phosphomannomutase